MALGPVMLDIEGRQLTPADRALLREPAVGGVILFSRNYESPSQLGDLVAAIRALRSPPLLIAVDHEGGRVQRFREGFSAIPPMRRLGRQYDVDPDEALSLAKTAGWLIASELRAMDIDLSFTPCVDLDWGISEIIGNRAFHRKPGVVADLASAYCNGLRSAGMAAIAKHFPGHGAVVADSHDQLPVDRRSYGDLLDDMQPYEKLIAKRQLAGVMVAHIVFSETDPLPASFSPYWIKEQLRRALGFDGAVLCDDLSMQATENMGSMPKRARLALEAGCDMVLICNNRPAASAAVAALRDYSNPLSLVRLVRLHGTGNVMRESLLASEEWHIAADRLQRWLDRPELKLDA
ncbi:MAG: beta-N-acetylhexosaminidase [Proteobacteria bacterium]|nr:beta-N-acetylhexosaminidase [Pseudomonadota bacterium]